jgi:hypothetical protein
MVGAAGEGISMAGTAKKAALLGFALIVILVGLVHIAYYFPRVVDDRFIYLRYAQNFAEGRGLAFNPPEKVEGFSSLPWVVLLSISFLTGLEAISFTKALGILSFFSLLGAVYLLARRLTMGNRALALLACLLVSLSSCIVSWSILGLETPLFLSALFWTIHALLRYQEAPVTGRGAVLAATAFIFGISRPEAPLYLAFIFASYPLLPRKGESFGDMLKAIIPPASAVIVILLLFEAGRFLYFRELVPHVYYAKKGSGINFTNLAPLAARGASIPDLLYVGWGFMLLLIYCFKRTPAAPLTGAALACLVHVVLVEEDWMPNLRFFLPLLVCLALAWTMALAWCLKQMAGRRLWALGAAIIDAVLALYVLQSARIESKFMTHEFHSHGEGKTWVRPKSLKALHETLLSYRCRISDDIRQMPIEHLGMIHQLFDVLEASSEPLGQSWFIGRDIGMVGYFSPVKIFDTDGLFTPALAADPAWREKRSVSQDLLLRGFSHYPVAAELLDGWGPAAASNKEIMKNYDMTYSQTGVPRDMRPKDRTPPSMKLVLERYRKAYEKFPKLYFIQTLHGESVGAAMERRLHYIQAVVKDHSPPTVSGIDKSVLAGRSSFPQLGVSALGCRIDPPKVRKGKEIVVRCYFEATRGAEGTYKLFMHFEGPSRFQGDHYPLGDLLPISQWPAGIVQDVFRLEVPPNIIPGTYHLYFGFYTWKERLKALPVEATDGNNRVAGPELVVED